MQFLTVSDEVVPAIYSLNIKERFQSIQAILGCGDLPPYYLEFIVTMLAKPCFYVDEITMVSNILQPAKSYTHHADACSWKEPASTTTGC